MYIYTYFFPKLSETGGLFVHGHVAGVDGAGHDDQAVCERCLRRLPGRQTMELGPPTTIQARRK